MTSEELKFPFLCHVKIIAENIPEMPARLEKVLFSMGIMNPVIAGNHSAKDRYISFNVSMIVNSKEYMEEMDQALRQVPGVRMVL